MTPSIFVNLSYWNNAKTSCFGNLPKGTTGVILGDPFCAKRMFPHGNLDLPFAAEDAKASGLTVAYMTPVYVTSRNYWETLDLIDLLAQKKALDFLFVHDIGLLLDLYHQKVDIPICWSYWGSTRSDVINRDYYEMLLELGVKYIETGKYRRVSVLQKYGVKIVYRLYAPKIVTFSRTCYAQYIFRSNCGNGTLCSKDTFINSENHKFKLRVSGHMLTYRKTVGKQLSGVLPEWLSIYANDASDLAQVWDMYGF